MNRRNRRTGVPLASHTGPTAGIIEDPPRRGNEQSRRAKQNGPPAPTRRQFLALVGVGLTVPNLLLRAAEEAGRNHPFASFDREVLAFMEARKVPGGALAVVKNRRLVYAQGYGLANREKKIPTRPETLFRIASVSKPITAVAVMKLVEEKRLSLDTRAFTLLGLKPVLADGRKLDARLERITINHLLHHTAGWDRDKSGDPMFRSAKIAKATGTPAPAPPEAIVRFMLGQPLDTDPGSHYAYSNFGYCVLGRVIEKITGLPYERYLREQILAPLGLSRMRIGATLTTSDGEARYYTPNEAKGGSVFPDQKGQVPEPYGTFCLEALDAHGGWLASAVDLAHFAAALDDPEKCPLLRPETLRLMYAPPDAPVSRQADGNLEAAYYSCGWMVRPVGRNGRANYWHSGSLPGTSTLLVRRWDGLSWAVLFNQRSNDHKLPDGAIDGALHRAADAVKEWPR